MTLLRTFANVTLGATLPWSLANGDWTLAALALAVVILELCNLWERPYA